MRYFSIILVVVVCCFGSLFAQDSTQTKQYSHAIQISPLGMLLKSYSGNYELLLNQKHGLVFEGTYYNSDDNDGYGLQFNYRKHKNSGVNSGYWGLFVRYIDNDVTITEEKNDRKTDYTFNSKSIYLGINSGKRINLGSGFTFAYRYGYGIPIGTTKWLDGKPEDDKLYTVLYKIFSGIDGELSIGYSF